MVESTENTAPAFNQNPFLNQGSYADFFQDDRRRPVRHCRGCPRRVLHALAVPVIRSTRCWASRQRKPIARPCAGASITVPSWPLAAFGRDVHRYLGVVPGSATGKHLNCPGLSAHRPTSHRSGAMALLMALPLGITRPCAPAVVDSVVMAVSLTGTATQHGPGPSCFPSSMSIWDGFRRPIPIPGPFPACATLATALAAMLASMTRALLEASAMTMRTARAKD